jgi:putative flavoprotein involved in K+ transport
MLAVWSISPFAGQSRLWDPGAVFTPHSLGSNTTKDPGPWEGEQRNMWKPTQQDALWFHGGNLHQSRHYSLYLALQLKARMEGIETPVYGLQEVHHLS